MVRLRHMHAQASSAKKQLQAKVALQSAQLPVIRKDMATQRLHSFDFFLAFVTLDEFGFVVNEANVVEQTAAAQRN